MACSKIDELKLFISFTLTQAKRLKENTKTFRLKFFHVKKYVSNPVWLAPQNNTGCDVTALPKERTRLVDIVKIGTSLALWSL